MYYFVEIACVAAEVWLSHLLLSSMLPKKEQSVWVLPAVYLLVALLLSVLTFIDGLAFLRIGVSVLLVWMIAVTVFRAHPIRGLVSAVLMCMIVALSDVLVSALFLRLGRDSATLMAHGSVRSLYVITGHLVMLGMVIPIYALNQRNHSIPPLRILLPIFPCWLASFLLCIALAWDFMVEHQGVSVIHLVALLGLLYTDIMVMYYINRLCAQEQDKLDRTLAEHHYVMQQEYYDQFRIQQEETRALWHDISKLIRAAHVEDSGENLCHIQEMLDAIPCVVDVENRVVSIVLNEYIQAAKNEEIEVYLDVSVPRELFVTAVDLYILLGNTLDNAIEACSAVPNSERRISIKLKTHNNILFYEIENPFNEGHLQRHRGKGHGYGLRNVQRCVEKYNGVMNIKKDDGIFRLTAHLNEI